MRKQVHDLQCCGDGWKAYYHYLLPNWGTLRYLEPQQFLHFKPLAIRTMQIDF